MELVARNVNLTIITSFTLDDYIQYAIHRIISVLDLNLKAPNNKYSRRHFILFLILSFEEN